MLLISLLVLAPFILGPILVPFFIRRKFKKMCYDRERLAFWTGENTSEEERVEEVRDEIRKLYPNIFINHILKTQK